MSNASNKKNRSEIEELELEKPYRGAGTPIKLKSPQSMTNLSATAKCIMDELRERHKGVKSRGGNNIHPGELLTLDKLQESLQKYSNLSTQSKSTESIDLALKQICDWEGDGMNRIVYLYPFLVNNNNKVAAKIALIAPQTSIEVDVSHFREICFNYSKGMIDIILGNRSKKVKEIEEEEPGKILMYKTKSGEPWLYPHLCSMESEITMLLKRAFKPYSYISVRDFVDDFIAYGREKNQLKRVLDNYHMIIDKLEMNPDGTYKRQPETVVHYRAQADGLEKFCLHYFPKFLENSDPTNYRSKLTHYRKDILENAEEGRKQSRGKVKELINLVNEFPFSRISSELSKKVEYTCSQSVKILDVMIKDMDSLIERKFDAIQSSLYEGIVNYVSEHTRKELTLLSLDVKQEIFRAGIKDEGDINAAVDGLKTHLKAELGTYEMSNEQGRLMMYCVDQGYMASVLHKLSSLSNTDPEMAEQLNIAKKIFEDLKLRNDPRINGKIREDHVNRLVEDINRFERDALERQKRENFRRKYNLPAGLSATIFCLIGSFFLASVESNVFFIVTGIPLSFIIGFISARFFRVRKNIIDIEKLKKNLISSNSSSEQMDDKSTIFASEENKSSKEEKTLEISKIAEMYVFPSTYNKIEDKIYDSSSLRSKINSNLEEIQRKIPILMKEEDMNKVASSIEFALLSHSVVINIPRDLVPRKMPGTIIINKSDFKTPLLRNQMAEFFRAELEKNKVDK
ncbi:MAG: hypothetical protein KDK45_13530, partial [Leptospiraceae bacterium]|nr:hypothetical protein [Leptospiraceae bacterium]